MSTPVSDTRPRTALWIGGAGALALLAIIASYFLFIGPQRAQASDLATERVAAQEKNAHIVAETDRLKTQFATLGERKAELAALLAKFPAEADVPALMTQLSAYSSASGVTITELTTGTPALHAGTSGAEQASGLTIVDVPVTLTIAGSFSGTELFLKNVQADMQRYFTVTSVTATTGSEIAGGSVSTQVEGVVYVVRDPAATTTTASTGGTTS